MFELRLDDEKKRKTTVDFEFTVGLHSTGNGDMLPEYGNNRLIQESQARDSQNNE